MDTSNTAALTATAKPSAQAGFARWRRRHREAIESWVILAPILLYYSIFFLFPVIANTYVSFTKWNGIVGAPKWVGLTNYKAFLRPPYPLTLFNTILFALVILALSTIVAFFIAVILNEKVVGRGLYRALWYIPTLTSSAVTAQVMFAFISPYDGVLNAILKALGEPIVIWMPRPALDAHVYHHLLGLARCGWAGDSLPGGVAGHPSRSVRGGAGGRRLLGHTTALHHLAPARPMTVFILITGTIGGFQIFETVMLISAGGQANVASIGRAAGDDQCDATADLQGCLWEL